MNMRWRVSLFINVARTESEHTNNNSKLNSTKKLLIGQKNQNSMQNNINYIHPLIFVYNITFLYVT